jgi:hypothetical protein
MTDPIEDPIAAFDQSLRAFKDFSKGTRTLYNDFRDSGFSKEEAFQLTRDWLIATVSGESARRE